MFSKIAKFFIENSKLTFVLVLITIISGIGSYLIIPKQYNPTIIVPAFQVIVEAPGLEANETSNLIVSPLENKIMELEGIDEVYGIVGDNYGAVMVKFQVGVDKEKAKIRLNQKLNENLELKPIGVSTPIVKTIDPDELPQITFAISYKGEDISEEEQYIYLRQIANILKEKIKTIENVTTLDIVGGYVQDLIIELDLAKIEAKNMDIMEVYDVLKKNNIDLPVGNINTTLNDRISVQINGKTNSIESLGSIIISNIGTQALYLRDIADIRYGIKRINKTSTYTKIGEATKNTVFLGIGKAIGTNAVFVTDEVENKVDKIKKELPGNVEINIIQNEGETAKNATNMLLINLVQSVIIVFIVLAIYLGFKDAFNTAISIPLTLGLVFLLALLFGENINRITLFALILVLGMLVDNSTVVVENISRHLKERVKTGKSKLESVLNGVQEVGVGVILSTLSRLLAFGAMFAVGGMMGEYMGPIPKFAIRALLISIAIAFTVNPWLSFLGAKDISEQDKVNHEKEKESPLKLRRKYLKLMRIFINNNPNSTKKRKLFKTVFWITLFVIIIAPIYAGIFKARMLPKSNQDQIYLWIDAPRGKNIEELGLIENDLINFFNNSKNIPKNLQIVDSINITSGQAFMGDFANLFRGGLNRSGENQISARINLVHPNIYEEQTGDSRIKSEKFVIELRPYLRDYLLKKYPDLQLRLLEDPPGPPVRATFLAKIKTDTTKENEAIFAQKIENEIRQIAQKQGIVDIGSSNSTTYKKLSIDIDHESLSRAGLTTQQVSHTLAIILNSVDIDTISNNNSYETSNIVLGVNEGNKNNINSIGNINFTNKLGQKIPLSSIANINYSFVSPEINTDKRSATTYIYGEMGDNSLIYPVIKLFGILMDEEFLGDDYKVIGWSPYEIKYIGLNDGKSYTLEWGGEWELTMDTFRDLGIAMGISLLAIYFLLVGQFASFSIAGIIMITFLLSFFGVFPGFTLLYLVQNEYFSATSMIGIIALGGIVVGNAIILIDYLNILKVNGITIEEALLKAGYVRFAPIILTSLTTVFGAATIVGDPVWSGLAWSIIWGLLLSSILTLIVIPIFYYDSQRENWK
ncbi:MAG: efflux RND transporter permease subunit [Candidatus Gracilibacteria bacterium]|nr:efflux RND transporter permease subunit [Candidatus Gracilibacteria bacterium]